MIFDINTSTGHWPFRKVSNENIGDLEKMLVEKGIGGAAVVNTHGLFYKNCQDSNLELAEMVSKNPFFTGVATLNPLYPAWEKDLDLCIKDLGMKGLRLVPQYHGYGLSSHCAREILSASSSAGLPVFIPSRVVDVRQRHWMDTGQTIDVREIGNFSLGVAGSRIIVTECAIYASQVLGTDNKPLYPGLFFETSRISSALGRELAILVKGLGADHLIFGSGAPFKEITPALLRVKHSGCTDEEIRKISWDNGRTVLGI